MTTIITIQSVSQIHAMLGREQPEHPLISVFEIAPGQPITATVPLVNTRFLSELYALSLTRGDESPANGNVRNRVLVPAHAVWHHHGMTYVTGVARRDMSAPA